MSGVHEEQLEIRFRLPDGSDIGPKSYSTSTTVSSLKKSIIAQWPKEMESQPRTVSDLKLINSGRIMEDDNTLAEYISPLCDLPPVTTMHVVLRPASTEPENKKKETRRLKEKQCECVIL